MIRLPKSLEKLINEFSKLPGIGAKTAQRLTFYMLKRNDVDVVMLSEAIANLKKDVVFCSICHNMTETDPCNICSDLSRNRALICVVEEPLDAQALDATGKYNGLYHVLGGVLSPLEGIGAESLNIDSLITRIETQAKTALPVSEVILATNSTLEGETTAMELIKRLKPLNVKVTRLARGLPIGGDLEYADEITIGRALEGRNEV